MPTKEFKMDDEVIADHVSSAEEIRKKIGFLGSKEEIWKKKN